MFTPSRPDTAARVERARDWLLASEAVTTIDRAYRLFGPSHHAYQRGVAYLMKTQEEDGSWFVQTRAASFNPYFESGFPHGMFQCSSFAGTAWATMALMYAAGPGTP